MAIQERKPNADGQPGHGKGHRLTDLWTGTGRHRKGLHAVGAPTQPASAGARETTPDGAAGLIPGQRAASAVERASGDAAPAQPGRHAAGGQQSAEVGRVFPDGQARPSAGRVPSPEDQSAEGHPDLPRGDVPDLSTIPVLYESSARSGPLFGSRTEDFAKPRVWQGLIGRFTEKPSFSHYRVGFPVITAIDESPDMLNGNPNVNAHALQLIAKSSVPLTAAQIQVEILKKIPDATQPDCVTALRAMAPLTVRPESAGPITEAILALREIPPGEYTMMRDIVQAGIEEDAQEGPLRTRLYYRIVPDLPASR